MRIESARRIGLQGVRAPRQAIKGYQGVGTITDSVYYLPLLDADCNIQVIRAHGVDEITIVARTRLPPIAREIFPVIRAFMPWMETGAGHVELLVGLDNRQWLPAHVEDDDMRLMRSVFGHRYMITDGWGRDLLPPDNAPGNQAGAQGGAAEQADAAQEDRLPEYRGWSQGTWSHGNGDRPGTTRPRGGCLGARPKSHGVTISRGASSTQRMEGLVKIKDEVQRAGQEAARRKPGEREWNPGSGESGQDSRPKREAAQKAMDALKKGADATRGRGRRKGRMYQRAGVRN